MKKESVLELEKRFKYLIPEPPSDDGYIHDLKLFGLMCNDGWYNLVYVLFTKIDEHLEYMSDKNKQNFFVSEVKEKWGGLRVYLHGFDNDNLIRKAENISQGICEDCGKKGILSQINYWWTTLCDECIILHTKKGFDRRKTELSDERLSNQFIDNLFDNTEKYDKFLKEQKIVLPQRV